MKTTTLALCLVIILSALCGCQNSNVTVERYTDGRIVVDYSRTSVFSEFNSDGMTLDRVDNDVSLSVAPVGTKTDMEALLEAMKIGMGLVSPVPVPVP